MDAVTTKQAAELLNVSPSQITWYYRRGLLHGERIGEHLLIFARRDIERFVKPTKTGRPKKTKGKRHARP